MSKTSWNNPLQLIILWAANHWMSFPATCLTISKHGAIITLYNMLNKWIRSFGINLFLLRLLSKNCVVCKTFYIISLIGTDEMDLIILLVYLCYRFTATLLLWDAEWPNSYYNFNALTHETLEDNYRRYNKYYLCLIHKKANPKPFPYILINW